MKRFLTVAVAMLALTGMGQVAMRKLEDLTNTNLVCVTDYGPRLDLIEPETNKWNAAYGWGDHALAGYLLPADLAPYATTAALTIHTNRTDNPHGVTAPQIGALTNELDLAALRAYHYGSPDIVESPAEWFVFNGAGTITAFNWEAGRTNVVIPWAIGGVPVTEIGESAFQMSGIVAVIAPQTVTAIGGTAFRICNSLTAVSLPQVTSIGNRAFGNCGSLTSVTIPQVTSIGNDAFSDCPSLASVSLPQAQTIGDSVFYNCGSLTSVSLPKAQTIGKNAFAYCSSLTSVHMGRNAPAEATSVFYGITPPPTVYVPDPQATGWGATWNGAPVVRPPLYGSNVTAQAFTLNGDTITEWPSGGGSVPYTDWTGTVTLQNGTATVTYAHGNMPVLVTDAPCVLTLDPTGYGTAGVSRVSLSYYTGTNSFTFATNIIDYAATPTVDTNGWNTLLIRRVSDGAWKGVGL